MITRRQLLKDGAALLAGGAVSAAFRSASAQERKAAATQPPLPAPPGQHYMPVVTLNGSTLPWKMDNGVKMFHLIAGPCKREFAPGMVVNCSGYNGSTPGPTLECVEGDRVRIFVSNRLKEHTTMTDFNMWTFNSRVFPGIDPMVARLGERVRIRIANLSMHEHPIHIHGTAFEVTGTDSGWIPKPARYRETSMLVPVGNIRVGEFVAELPGDWAIHCHKSHHTMNAMGHGIPNMLGVDQSGVEERIQKLLPDYMAMGTDGMAEHAAHTAMGHMPLPENTLPMMTGEGPFGPLEMGGMFTVVKIRENLASGDYRDPGWYQHPPGTVAWKASDEELKRLFG